MKIIETYYSTTVKEVVSSYIQSILFELIDINKIERELGEWLISHGIKLIEVEAWINNSEQGVDGRVTYFIGEAVIVEQFST